ncbi:hypothetical protein EDB80DRAFT_341571 [Ilyonectria destructans]|nr:hypothetical protein EDB80DRAFT_341571 [Ilyonectria destructans]
MRFPTYLRDLLLIPGRDTRPPNASRCHRLCLTSAVAGDIDHGTNPWKVRRKQRHINDPIPISLISLLLLFFIAIIVSLFIAYLRHHISSQSPMAPCRPTSLLSYLSPLLLSHCHTYSPLPVVLSPRRPLSPMSSLPVVLSPLYPLPSLFAIATSSHHHLFPFQPCLSHHLPHRSLSMLSVVSPITASLLSRRLFPRQHPTPLLAVFAIIHSPLTFILPLYIIAECLSFPSNQSLAWSHHWLSFWQ